MHPFASVTTLNFHTGAGNMKKTRGKIYNARRYFLTARRPCLIIPSRRNVTSSGRGSSRSCAGSRGSAVNHGVNDISASAKAVEKYQHPYQHHEQQREKHRRRSDVLGPAGEVMRLVSDAGR